MVKKRIPRKSPGSFSRRSADKLSGLRRNGLNGRASPFGIEDKKRLRAIVIGSESLFALF
jgi:hypothetical protein